MGGLFTPRSHPTFVWGALMINSGTKTGFQSITYNRPLIYRTRTTYGTPATATVLVTATIITWTTRNAPTPTSPPSIST